MGKVTNKDILEWTGLPTSEDLLVRKNLRWTGYLMRISPDKLPKQVLSLLSIVFTRHDDRAGTPNGPHRIESPDHRGQIRSVQRPRARACGGQEKTTSWDICERRLLAENYGETQRTSPQNDESTRRREDRLPVV